MTGSIVLSANFLTLAGMILTSCTALGVAMITQGRHARDDREALKKTVIDGYLDTVKRSDAVQTAVSEAHDEIRTGNGKTAGEYLVASARALEDHIQTDDLRAVALFANAGIEDPAPPKGRT